MKWKKKGKDTNLEGKRLSDEFLKHNKFSIYGAGITGEKIYYGLKAFGCFGVFLDSNKDKQETGKLGEPVLSIEEFLNKKMNDWIVIGAVGKNADEIRRRLEKAGLAYRKNFISCEEFRQYIFPLTAMYFYEKCFVHMAQICVTERCTLRCEKCAHACYAVNKSQQDLPFEKACKSADSFFNITDYTEEFVLIGGEPLMYRKLPELIQYIGERYRDKIGTLSITTNGTITPGKELCEVSRKYKVFYSISNYSYELPWLEEKHSELEKMLKTEGISYSLAPKDLYWMDYGFEEKRRLGTEEETIRKFDMCKTQCHEVRENRYYYCVMARAVSENLGLGLGREDFLDLDSLDKDKKKIFMEYNLGYNDKGYLDMCRHCNGGEIINHTRIPAGRQMV